MKVGHQMSSYIFNIISLLGGLALFLFGMDTMGKALERQAGGKLQTILAKMSSTVLKGFLLGAAVTAVIQSSSATTVMVVGFVNSGIMKLQQAVGIIMGANIGTTMTAQLIAFKISDYIWPIIFIGFVIYFLAKQENIKYIGETIFAFGLLFLGIDTMGAVMKPLAASPVFVSMIQQVSGIPVLGVLVGTLMTVVVQSSSATIAVLQNFASTAGPDGVSSILGLEGAIPILFGDNIGTTITANIAAAVANTSAKRAARAHTIFNIIGVIWVLCLFRPIVKLICIIMSELGFVDPTMASSQLAAIAGGSVAADAEMIETYKNSLLYGIAMLHTLFNVTNTLVLIWFTPLIEKAVVWLVKEPKGETEVFRLKYISGGPLSTAELSLNEAQQELIHFAEICRNGFGYIRQAINETDPEAFDKLNDKLIKYEEITDRIEYEIATYLNDVSKNEISDEVKDKIKAMYKIVGELESLGDSGEAIGRILKRKNAHGKVFDKSILDRLNKMMDLVQKGYDVMIENLKEDNLKDISNAENCEYNINECRNHLREEHIVNIESNSYNYLTGVYFMDVLSELEKIGDFLINVSQAVVGKYEYEN